jgi:hypothetical protein
MRLFMNIINPYIAFVWGLVCMPLNHTKYQRKNIGISLYSGFTYRYETDVLICDDMISSFQPPSNKMHHNRKAT